MVNDWIKMRLNLAEDPAVIGIAARTKLDRYAVVGRLHVLWGWADQNTTDGFIPHATAAFIDEKVGCKGFASAMSSPGIEWLVIEENGIRFPHFDRHNGESAKKRAVDTDKKRRLRTGQNSENCPDSVPKIEGQNKDKYPEHVPKNSGHDPGQKADKSGTRVRVRSKQQQQKRLVSISTDFPDLAKLFPQVDLHAELQKARRYVQEKRGPTAEVEIRFFTDEWLPKAPASARSPAADRCPAGFAAWLEKEFPDVAPDVRRGYVEGPWSAVPRELREKFNTELTQ